MARRIAIVGGGYAGLLCAVRLARKTREEDAQIVLFTERPYFVERIRLHEDAAGPVRRRRPLRELLGGSRVEVRVGRVHGADLAGRRLFVDARPCGVEKRARAKEAFDDLVLATGSIASRPHIPGIERAFACANEDDMLALRAELDARPRARVVVVGGGLTGIELASELGERRPDLALTLVTDDEVGPMVTGTGRAHVRAVLAKLGVALREHERVAACEEGAVVLASGETLASDVVVWAGGFEASPLARALDLEVDELGRAFVDRRLRSRSHPFVRVIGDAARVAIATHADDVPSLLRMACATAVPQGAFAADALATELRRSEAPEAAFSFGYAGRCVSLGRKNGIIQLADAWDLPHERWIGGRTAALVKEAVCRYPLASVRLERWGFAYRWPKAPPLERARMRGALTGGANGSM